MSAEALAVGQDREFAADKKDDPLRRVTSVISIVADENKDAAGIDIDLMNHKIFVRLSKANFDNYDYLRQSQSLAPVLCSSVIVPALVDVIDRLRRAARDQALSEFENLRWYMVLSRRLRALGKNPEDLDTCQDSSLKLAQDLIGQPLTASLEGLKSMVGEGAQLMEEGAS